jgi:WG containing repeat
MKRPRTAPPLIPILLTLLSAVVTFGSVGCHAGQHATSLTTTTEFKPALLPVPQGTGSNPLSYEWGYVGTDGNWVIKPQFAAAGFFVEGLAPVKLGAKWGYVDKTGSIVIEPQFTEAYYFRDGMARVATGPPPNRNDRLVAASGYGFIDKTGRIVIPAEWDAADDFSEGLAAVMRGSACGFIDTSGKLVIPLKFDLVGSFSEGLAQASVGGKCGYIDTKGNWRIKPRYVGVPSSAVLQYDTTFLLGGRFKSGLAPVYLEGGELSGGTCQYIDQTGKKAFPEVFQRGGEYSEGLAPVQVDDKWGFIDTSGRMAIEPQYD